MISVILLITDLIREKDVWETLKNSPFPSVMYGMGNGADKILNICAEKGIEICDFFASDSFVRGHSFHGKRVLTYSQIKEKYGRVNVVLAFATNRDEVIENILKINAENPVFAPDVPVAGDGLFTREFVERHEKMFDEAYEMLSDDESKKVYADTLNFKISGKIKYLFPFADKKHVYRDILRLTSDEIIVDAGAYDGDTIREITDCTGGRYNKIFAFEPDKKNYKKLIKNTADMQNISLFNAGLWSTDEDVFFENKSGRNSSVGTQGEMTHMLALDNAVNSPVTLIKMDIEGSELNAVEGAKDTIKAYLPKLYICAYHRNEDMFSIPLAIKKISPEYKLYFRHHKYIPAWESNFYFTHE